MDNIKVQYEKSLNEGILSWTDLKEPKVWSRLVSFAQSIDKKLRVSGNSLHLNWAATLDLLREFSGMQRVLEFRFVPTDEAIERIAEFKKDFAAARAPVEPSHLSLAEMQNVMVLNGWDPAKRVLKSHQLENLGKLSSMFHGANFSVPGAGKTTVSLALNLVLADRLKVLLVVAPRNAFLAWREVISECLVEPPTGYGLRDGFSVIESNTDIMELLQRGVRRLIVSYDVLMRYEPAIKMLLTSHSTHLILDESHKMKAGFGSRRGSSLLKLSHLAARRDILSGTPMPQSARDIQSQFDFLWPGAGLGNRILRGESPRDVIRNRYVRTTKNDLGLPDRASTFVDVDMSNSHLALYSIVKNELLRQASQLKTNSSEILKARKSVIRLLQISTNPVSALAAMHTSHAKADEKAIYARVVQDGASTKVLKTVELARELIAGGNKVLIWSIFTDTIDELSELVADLNPVVIRGGIASGDVDDFDTREGRINRFRNDANCWIMIANPAAASEGMSLHMQCHHAIYVDRSFNATHYLQSIDRIHRLGLPPDVKTNIYILRNRVPTGVGSVDLAVGRRLAAKIRALDDLLNDPDLGQLALDEDNANDLVNYGISAEDIIEIIREIEGIAATSQEPI